VSGQRHALAALHLGKEDLYPLNRTLGGTHSRSGRFGEKFLASAENGSPDRLACSLVTILTELFLVKRCVCI
jgi:hypothetical protein